MFLQANVAMAFLLIAVHRFLLVVQPFPSIKPPDGARVVICVIVVCVLAVVIVLIPPLFDIGGRFQQSEITGICTSLVRQNTLVYNYVTQLMTLTVPVVLMTICYLSILRTVLLQNRRITAARATVGAFQPPDVRERMRRRRYTIRVTLLSAISVIIFVLTYTPFILGTLFPWKLDTYLYSAITTVITFSHTVTSPFIYVCGDTEFRKTLRSLWPGRSSVERSDVTGSRQSRPSRRTTTSTQPETTTTFVSRSQGNSIGVPPSAQALSGPPKTVSRHTRTVTHCVVGDDVHDVHMDTLQVPTTRYGRGKSGMTPVINI